MNVQKITADLSELPRSWGPDFIASLVETGVIQINDDWPAIHIRGDSACWHAMQLDQAIDLLKQRPYSGSEYIIISGLTSLSELLKSSIVRHNDSIESCNDTLIDEDDIPIGC